MRTLKLGGDDLARAVAADRDGAADADADAAVPPVAAAADADADAEAAAAPALARRLLDADDATCSVRPLRRSTAQPSRASSRSTEAAIWSNSRLFASAGSAGSTAIGPRAIGWPRWKRVTETPDDGRRPSPWRSRRRAASAASARQA